MRTIISISLCLLLLCACKKDKSTPKTDNSTDALKNMILGQSQNSTIISYDGNVIICGTDPQPSNIYLLKLTKAGKLLWKKNIISLTNQMNNFIQPPSLVESDNHDLFVLYNGYNLIKTDLNGNLIWKKSFQLNDSTYIDCNKLIKTKDGNIMLGGINDLIDGKSNNKLLLLKLNTNGDTLWSNTYSCKTENAKFDNVIETKNGEFLLKGENHFTLNDSRGDIYVKVDAKGKIIHRQEFDTLYGNDMPCLELSTGDFITMTSDAENVDPCNLLIKFDNTLNIINNKKIEKNGKKLFGSTMVRNSDDTFTIGGVSEHPVLSKFNLDGKQIWVKEFSDFLMDDYNMNIIRDDDDSYLITFTESQSESGSSGFNIQLLRIDKNGNQIK